MSDSEKTRHLVPNISGKARTLGIKGPARHQVLHRGAIVALSEAQPAVECVSSFNALHVKLYAKPGPVWYHDRAVDDSNGSPVRRWPSCQIQCVSMAVTFPGEQPPQ